MDRPAEYLLDQFCAGRSLREDHHVDSVPGRNFSGDSLKNRMPALRGFTDSSPPSTRFICRELYQRHLRRLRIQAAADLLQVRLNERQAQVFDTGLPADPVVERDRGC